MRRTIHLTVVVMLIVSFLPLVLPPSTQPARAGSAPPPDDGVDGAYAQYLDGLWEISDEDELDEE